MHITWYLIAIFILITLFSLTFLLSSFSVSESQSSAPVSTSFSRIPLLSTSAVHAVTHSSTLRPIALSSNTTLYTPSNSLRTFTPPFFGAIAEPRANIQACRLTAVPITTNTTLFVPASSPKFTSQRRPTGTFKAAGDNLAPDFNVPFKPESRFNPASARIPTYCSSTGGSILRSLANARVSGRSFIPLAIPKKQLQAATSEQVHFSE